MERTDVRTYSDYIDLRKEPRKAFIMISELIDNSISSFENYYNNQIWKEKAVINIKFYLNKNDLIEKNNLKISPSSYIEVSDNGFGIKTEEDLINAISLNKKNNNSNSKMNRHGRGLKQCAFYFGADLTVESWNEKNEILLSELHTSKFSPEDSVIIKAIKVSEDYPNIKISKKGTIIKISNIYENKFLSQNKYDVLKNAISYRYIKYIESGKIKLNFIDDIFNEDSSFSPITESIEKIAFVNENFEIEKREEIEKIIIKAKEKIDKKFKEKNSIFSGQGELLVETMEKINQILNESLTNEKRKFSWNQILDIRDKKINVNFWMISSKKGSGSFSHLRGFRVYEGERALMHPPITPDDKTGTSTFIDPLPATSASGSTENRFAGSFDILEMNGQTSTDKSDFQFENSEDEIILIEKLKIVYKIFDIYVMLTRKADLNEEGTKINSKDAENIKNVIEQKFGKNIGNIDYIEDENKFVIPLNIDENIKWILNLEVESHPSPDYIWTIEIKLEENQANMTVYSGHLLWKKIDKNPNFKEELLCPISVLIAFNEVKMKILNNEKENTHFSFFDQFNKTAKIIEK